MKGDEGDADGEEDENGDGDGDGDGGGDGNPYNQSWVCGWAEWLAAGLGVRCEMRD